MTDYVYPSPPMSSEWYDPAKTRADVLAVLRLTEQDIDVPRVDAAIPAAAQLIDQRLDRVDVLPGPPPPDPVYQALVQTTVELYRRKDAPLDPVRGGAVDILEPVMSELLPWVQRWGAA